MSLYVCCCCWVVCWCCCCTASRVRSCMLVCTLELDRYATMKFHDASISWCIAVYRTKLSSHQFSSANFLKINQDKRPTDKKAEAQSSCMECIWHACMHPVLGGSLGSRWHVILARFFGRFWNYLVDIGCAFSRPSIGSGSTCSVQISTNNRFCMPGS